MDIEDGHTNGPQVGGSLTRWHAHLVVCEGGPFSDDLSVAATNAAVRAVPGGK